MANNATYTFMTSFTEEQLQRLDALYNRTKSELDKIGYDQEITFEDFIYHHIPAYFFEHIEENAKLELLEGFGLDETEIGDYERTGKLPFPEIIQSEENNDVTY